MDTTLTEYLKTEVSRLTLRELSLLMRSSTPSSSPLNWWGKNDMITNLFVCDSLINTSLWDSARFVDQLDKSGIIDHRRRKEWTFSRINKKFKNMIRPSKKRSTLTSLARVKKRRKRTCKSNWRIHSRSWVWCCRKVSLHSRTTKPASTYLISLRARFSTKPHSLTGTSTDSHKMSQLRIDFIECERFVNVNQWKW